MRLRHIPGSEEAIAQSPYVIQDGASWKGRWNQVFGNQNPLEIEVGMGKGRFIMEMARRHPDRNFVGIERYSSVLLRGLQKLSDPQNPDPGNIRFMCLDAKILGEIFAPGEVSRIYLNFSDPWPKDRHARRRLTSPEFLSVYDQILAPAGTIEFKTDNRGLFDYSLESIPAAGWNIDFCTFDLHGQNPDPENVMTEYEMKFHALGNPICKLIASRSLPGTSPCSVS